MEVDPLGDLTKSLRTMVDGIHGGDDCKENLSGADVARRLFAADMLFASLESESIGWIAICITGDTNQTSGQASLELITNS